MQSYDILEGKENKVLFPTRNRISRSKRAYKRRNTTKTEFLYPNKTSPVIVHETRCGTSINCRIIASFVRASGFPVLFQKSSCCKKSNVKLFDDTDRSSNNYSRSKVPALEDNGFLLFEIGAIIRYLNNKFLGSILIPSDPKEQSIVDQAFEHLISTLRKSVAKLIYCKIFRPFFCKKCELEKEDCFIRAESDGYLNEIEIYLRYIEQFYFRDKNGAPICKFSSISANKKKTEKSTFFNVGNLSVTQDFFQFTPISPPCLNNCHESTLEKLANVLGYNDSLDSVEALIKWTDKKMGESKLVLEEEDLKKENLFVVLEQFTLADVTLFVIIDHLQFVDYSLLKFPLICKWKKQMLKISSLKDNNISIKNCAAKIRKQFSDPNKSYCFSSDLNW